MVPLLPHFLPYRPPCQVFLSHLRTGWRHRACFLLNASPCTSQEQGHSLPQPHTIVRVRKSNARHDTVTSSTAHTPIPPTTPRLSLPWPGFHPEPHIPFSAHISLFSCNQNGSSIFLYIFWPWHFWRVQAGYFVDVSFNWGLSGVPSRLDSGCVSLARIQLTEDIHSGVPEVGLSPSWGC